MDYNNSSNATYCTNKLHKSYKWAKQTGAPQSVPAGIVSFGIIQPHPYLPGWQ